MEKQKETLGMLDLMISPVFCVKNKLITKVNPSAAGLLITEGTDIQSLLHTGAEEYRDFNGGCLSLTLSVFGQLRNAYVTQIDDCDVFILDDDFNQKELRSLALAARELREPLANVMTSANQLFPTVAQDDSVSREQAARMNRGLYQLLRILGNMSDADHYASGSRQEMINISGLFDEIFEKATVLVENTRISLDYHGLSDQIICLADGEQLERAVLNMLSNAIKFTPAGGSIEASLTRCGHTLRLSVQDSGSGIAEDIRSSVFRRYQRQPAIEDGRFGIGLGMVLIRSAAANHGGTVLIDHPSEKGTRISMTISIRQNTDTILRSHILRVDYAGERDHALVELADCLPIDLYDID